MSPRRTKDTHLPPCVYQRHGAYWLVKKGKWTRLGSNLHEALSAYAGLIDAPAGGMERLISEALAAMKKRKLSKNTLQQYEIAAARLKKTFQAFAPEQVQQRHVAQFKQSLAHKPNMANRCISVLRMVFEYAVEQQLVANNPVVGIRRHAEAKRTRLITEEEYAAIYARAVPRLQVIMELLRGTGQRVNDVLTIRESQIKKDGIEFRQQKTGTLLLVAWTPGLEAAVARARELQGPVRSLTLMVGRRRKAPDYRSVKLQWDVACKAASVADAHIHDLRAVAATEARRQGLNATKLLGHSSTAQTDRYLRDRDAVVVEAPSFGQSNGQRLTRDRK